MLRYLLVLLVWELRHKSTNGAPAWLRTYPWLSASKSVREGCVIVSPLRGLGWWEDGPRVYTLGYICVAPSGLVGDEE